MRTITLLCSSLLLAACATAPEPAPRAQEVTTIRIHSLPPGCFVEYNNEFVGQTPCTLTVPSIGGDWEGYWNQTHVIRASIPRGNGWDQRTWFVGDKVPQRVVLRIPGAETWWHANRAQPPEPNQLVVR